MLRWVALGGVLLEAAGDGDVTGTTGAGTLWFSSSLPEALSAVTSAELTFIATLPRPQLRNAPTDPPLNATAAAAGRDPGPVATLDGAAIAVVRGDADADGAPAAGGWAGPYTIAVSGLGIGAHTVSVRWDAIGATPLRYAWTVVVGVPNVVIWNPPTARTEQARAGAAYTAHLGVGAGGAVLDLQCRLSRRGFDWRPCCNQAYPASDPDCRAGCLGLEPHRCLPAHVPGRPERYTHPAHRVDPGDPSGGTPQLTQLISCAEALGMAAAVELAAGTGAAGWARCGADVDVGEMGTRTGTAHLFEAVATGLGGARGGVAAWRWAVLPPFPLSTNDSAPSFSQASATRCPEASVPLTAFAVVSWLLVVGLVGTLALRRDQLQAGLDPVKARMKQAGESTRQLSFTAAKPIEVVLTRSAKRAGKKRLKKEKNEPSMVVNPAMVPASHLTHSPIPAPAPAPSSPAAASPSKTRKPQGRRRGSKKAPPPAEFDDGAAPSPFAMVSRKMPVVEVAVGDRYRSGATTTNPAFATPFALVKRAPPKSNISVSELL